MLTEHLVLTRFNVPQNRFAQDRSGQSVLDDSWMQHRVRLFETICLPSMRNQSTQAFRWLCFFSTQTSARWRARIVDWSEGSRLEAHFVDSSADLVSGVVAAVDPRTEFLVSQRMDNDDALHRDAVAQTAQLAQTRREHPVTVIDLRRGLCVTQESWYRRKCPLSQFVAVAETKSNSPWRTAWHTTHVNMASTGPVVILRLRDAWITSMHDRNLINTIWGGRWNPSVQWNRLKVVLHNATIRRGWRRGELSSQWYPEQRITYSKQELRRNFGIEGAALNLIGLKTPDR